MSPFLFSCQFMSVNLLIYSKEDFVEQDGKLVRRTAKATEQEKELASQAN
ncbi:hypothetical protein JCM14450A_17100 [Geobacillus stearothermophilus]